MEHIPMIVAVSARFPELKGYQHFDVDDAIARSVHELSQYHYFSEDQEFFDAADMVIPASFRLPAQRMTLRTGSNMFWLQQIGCLVDVWHVSNRFEKRFLGRIRAGSVPEFRPSEMAQFLPDGDGSVLALLTHISWLILIVNEPRIVQKKLSGTRQQRRAAERGMGFAVDAWTRVSWDLSKPTAAKNSRDSSFHCVALHWRRGHWRRAEKHYKGAVQRPDALRVEDRALWWQWIDEQWVGHIAFGIKKSIHAPKMSLGRLAKRRAA